MRPTAAKPSADIKVPPPEADDRQRIRDEADRVAAGLDRYRPPRRADLEDLAGAILSRLHLERAFLGFTMVAVNNAFWLDQFAAIPPSRRLLLLPRCLRDARACRGTCDEVGLTCAACGACNLNELQQESESLGYKVIIAEGTPVVVRIVLSGGADAILGVACLDSLEKAFSRVVDLGIPHVAVPLLRDGCADTAAEIEIVRHLIRLRAGPQTRRTRSFVPLLRAAEALFDQRPLDHLLSGCVHLSPDPEVDAPPDPTTETERIALEWLRAGGKRFRPFITLAGHAAVAHGPEALDPDAVLTGRFPLAVERAALAIEALHKASLVHDDIEDDDAFRYGRKTLHRRYGAATAINVGDYLIGLGYRLVSAGKDDLGAECVADILAHLSQAHLKLCRGQGAEIMLASADPRTLESRAVQRIYALKTAPAFEAALFAGIRTARPDQPPPENLERIRRYARFLGVAYQLRNDLKDCRRDGRDKVVSGQDLIAARPTLLRAMAIEAREGEAGEALLRLNGADMPPEEKIQRLRDLYDDLGVFDKAETLVEGYRERARVLADGAGVLAELMRFIVETVL